jgi:hypothetical protein
MDWLAGWEERRLGSFLKYLIKQTGNYPNPDLIGPNMTP